MLEDVSFRPVVLLRPAVGHDDDHRLGLAVGDQVVEEDVGRGEALPLRLVAADAVQEIEHRVLLVLRVAGRRVDLHLARGPDGLRLVGHHLQLAVRDAFALGVKAGRRIGKRRNVVRVEHDGPAEPRLPLGKAFRSGRGENQQSAEQKRQRMLPSRHHGNSPIGGMV